MTDRKLLQMALDALEAGVKISPNSELHERFRAALAQPEPEPVGKVHVHDDYYAHVEWFHADGVTIDQQLLYTAPPQREWQGLTAWDLSEIPPTCYEGAIWAEAKLKEKNT